jgi:cytidylate kinase
MTVSAERPEARDVVAIDGPSGAGKSTVARRLAAALGFAYLDTGAMYRAVTWYLLENGMPDLGDDAALEARLARLRLQLHADGRVSVDGRDVTNHLRSREVETQVSAVSAVPIVRRHLRRLQRQVAAYGPLVAEGRDMASVVFPHARWKIYLDADRAERARRRHRDFIAQGREVSRAEVEEEIAVRDQLDSSRKDAPLARAGDATLLDTSGLSVEEVVARIGARVRADLAADGAP